ncbi:hypothetical protein Baya_5134 [Bagarius yarrelli]|uniref:Uncharacterized protein n=1 Tax=Bagarius yarrelli TaxID=175774 RepID=A0A556TTN3_BAGYA|nr:hypothetical protein Baya_5134 [Bagarius yarrelli]
MKSERVLLAAVLFVLLGCSRFRSAEASRMKSGAALPIQPEREPVPSKGVSAELHKGKNPLLKFPSCNFPTYASDSAFSGR